MSKQKRIMVPAYNHAGDTRKRAVRVVSQRGLWCINTALPLNGEGYNVTHLPTRHAAITGLPLSIARQAMKDCASLKGDWTFTDPKDITPQQMRAGKRIKTRWIAAANRERAKRMAKALRNG